VVRERSNTPLYGRSQAGLSLSKNLYDKSRVLAATRVLLVGRKKKKGKKKIKKNSERSSITLRQYSKANVVFAYVRRSFVYRVKISFHRGLFQKWIIRDEKAKVRFKVEILDV